MSKLRNNLSKIIWSDSKIVEYSFAAKCKVFELTIVDYQNEKLKVRFTNVEYNFIDDPVYISNAKFSESNGESIAEFSDDDSVVIKIIYERSEVLCL